MPCKIAVITGATRGIGKGIALELAKLGLGIVAVGTRDEAQAADALDEIRAQGVQVAYVQADVSKAEGRDRIVAATREAFGRLDVLVNNAGVAPKERLDVLEMSEESFDWVFGINLKGPLFLTQQAAKWMIEQREADPGRCPVIINVSSVSAYASTPRRAQYCISKAGMGMMTMVYADRLAEHGIGVYELRPGIIATDMTAAVKAKYDKLIAEGLTPIARWGQPEDVGRAAAAIVAGYLPFSTGEVINVDGGFHIRRL